MRAPVAGLWRKQRRPSHERRPSRGRRRGPGDATGTGAGGTPPLGRWITSTCTAPPRRRTTPPRIERCCGCSARTRHVVPPRAGPGIPLGAAGITEAAFVWLCLEYALIPGLLNTRRIDPNLGAGVVLNNREQPLRVALSNSFGFGGTNCSLLFGRRVANTLQVEGVGLMAPGLAGWPNGRAVLSGARPYVAEAMPTAIAALLPANERRRTTATVKLALQVAQEAALQADIDPTPRRRCWPPGGDSEVLDKICAALTLPDRPVSPTHFHHSVHNTPAGYWSIATRCAAASLSLSAYDDSFAAGLMEAAALAWTDQTRVLLVAYDLPRRFRCPNAGRSLPCSPWRWC